MNQGLDIDDRGAGGRYEGPPTHFFKGCAVSPFKQFESEVMAQYFKLSQQIAEGADFVITQVGLTPANSTSFCAICGSTR